MHGLAQIIAINNQAHLVAEDKARQAKGYKPRTPAAAILRKARSAAAQSK